MTDTTITLTANDFYSAIPVDAMMRIRAAQAKDLVLIDDGIEDDCVLFVSDSSRFSFVEETDHEAIYHTNEGFIVIVDTESGTDILTVEDSYEAALEATEFFDFG